MPDYVVDIEWPLAGDNVGQTFTPVAVVRNEDDIGPAPPPAADHFVRFTLFSVDKSGDTKQSQEDSGLIDPTFEPTVSSGKSLTTTQTGSHKLRAQLIGSDGTTVIDTDNEDNLNVTVNGPADREIVIIIEELA